MFVDNDWQNGLLSSPDCRENPFLVIFLHQKRLKRKAGIAITEKALTIRSKKQKGLSKS